MGQREIIFTLIYQFSKFFTKFSELPWKYEHFAFYLHKFNNGMRFQMSDFDDLNNFFIFDEILIKFKLQI